MTLLTEYDLKISKDVKGVTHKVTKFYSDVVSGSPVAKGIFRDSWELIKNSELSWTIYNPMKYGPVLWNGRIKINGRYYGSTQGWGLEGGDKLLDAFEQELKA